MSYGDFIVSQSSAFTEHDTKTREVGNYKYFNPGKRLLRAAISVDVFSATCIREANDSANIVAIKERALPITFEARSQCVKCNWNLYRGSR